HAHRAAVPGNAEDRRDRLKRGRPGAALLPAGYQVMRAVYCSTRAPCAEFRRLMIPSVLGVPMPGWFRTLNASRFSRSFTFSVISTVLYRLALRLVSHGPLTH